MTETAAGRPRSFDRDAALRDAAHLFWRHGFSGTSTRMLATTLGISTSSLYNAFGSKAELFDEAVRTYARRYSAIYERAVAETSIARVLERVLLDSVDEFSRTDQGHPGCLTSSAVMADTSTTLDVRTYVMELQRSDESRLRARIEQAVREGDMAPTTDAAAVSELVQTLWHGLSERAELGAGREELRDTARFALELLRRGATGDRPADPGRTRLSPR
ncbi:TetR/AcrR family transcriptional regulator [Promicromonospora thailandica]|uniref:Transcriptional regulator, TetR family n=1 Tax=Promicromonospora thailandica TaxID=765201 RepID=A0A9X2GBA1_9MICO|nr:TetR/AcrR family transcriptional regulator [Promicromonospora thailandica]MCP2266051.1 transcriptional regulator, TetR family [Promicromonospora thailandica]BFF21350.1 TetR/AcrR family transcriptional regulator [Promicromonospora thailandica]